MIWFTYIYLSNMVIFQFATWKITIPGWVHSPNKNCQKSHIQAPKRRPNSSSAACLSNAWSVFAITSSKTWIKYWVRINDIYIYIIKYIIIEGSLEVKLPTNMDSWKAAVRRVRREKIRRKKMQMREKVGKSRNTVFFKWCVAPEGRKVGSLKRRVRTQLAR